MQLSDPNEQKRKRALDLTALIILIIFPILAYFLRGIDFAKGTLLGSGVVFANYLISQRIILKFVTEKSFSVGLGLIYIFKFGGTLAILYYAVTVLRLNTFGVLVGLSSIIVTIALSSVARVALEKQQHQG